MNLCRSNEAFQELDKIDGANVTSDETLNGRTNLDICSDYRNDFLLWLHKKKNHEQIFDSLSTEQKPLNEGNCEKRNVMERIVSSGEKSNDTNTTNNMNVSDFMDKKIENYSDEKKLNKRKRLVRDCQYFNEHPGEVTIFKGEDELSESYSLPAGWMTSTRILTSGRKIPSYISPDRVLSFRSKVSMFEYIKFEGNYSDEDFKDLVEIMKKYIKQLNW